jgi:phosphoglycerol transferase MdoB-like AlkP superfamily enzyme
MTFGRFMKIAGGGIRFDITAMIYINILFIFISLLPFRFIYMQTVQTVLKVIYMLTNSIALGFNIADMAYFRFTLRRMAFSFFEEFSNDGNVSDIVITSLSSYWYLVLLWLAMITALWFCYGKIGEVKKRVSFSVPYLIFEYTVRTVILAVGTGLCIGGVRGGFHTSTRPITLSNAGVYVTQPLETYIVLNTPFSVIRTINKETLNPLHYFATEEALDKVYTPVHYPESQEEFCPTNVIVIILESFARYHSDALNIDIEGLVSYTPFLDSLIAHSRAYNNAFASGTKSIDAIPSVLGSIPTLKTPYVLTPYALNKTKGLGSLLREKGYHTSFFHGAQNNSMGFSSIVNMLGFEHYYGRSEYNNDDDYDGMWGIWDEPFLQFYAYNLNTFPQPFVSAIFTLSSHHPFKVPEEYKDKFPKGTLPVHQCIGYADHALRRFFETISKMSWFENTLFVITADHSIWSEHYSEYQNPMNALAIPIIYYHPKMEQPVMDTTITQQIDIMPSILAYLSYNKPYIAFGQDIMTTEHPFVYNYNGGYQLLYNGYLLLSDGEKTTGFYRWVHRGFSGLGDNLLNTLPEDQEKSETFLKALMQQYNNRMIENKLTLE